MHKRIFAVLALVLAATAAAGQGAPQGQAVATFAGGCFWCTEADFDKVEGVISTTSGYTGGKVENPTYQQVSRGATGHAEAVRIVYDPSKVTYQHLLEVFWRSIDPFARNAQFCDSGEQYRSAIFYHDEEQKRLAEESRDAARATLKAPKEFQTQIVAAGPFYPAEEYHQDYYKKNPTQYSFYRYRCGRDQRLEQIWGKKSS